MRLTTQLASLAAKTLPEASRARYREEWQADLDQAEELGISPAAVLWGIFVVAVRMDRGDPHVTGIPAEIQAIRQARWSASFLLSAMIVSAGIGLHILGGFGPLMHGETGRAIAVWAFVLILSLTLLGILTGMAALHTGIPVFGVKRVLEMVLLALGMILATGIFALMPIFGIMMSLGGVAAVLFLAAGGPRGQAAQKPLSARHRVMLSSFFSLLVLGVVAFGTLHILVWNPLAKMPGMNLGEIYAAMADARQPAGIGIVVTWAVVVALAAIAFPISCSFKKFGGPRSTRRIIVTGMMLVATAGATHWIAGFATGMSLADTFGVSGADSAKTGGMLMLTMLLAIIVAVFVALTPARWQAVAAQGC